MARRSMWNGAIAFGALTVPVKVYAATSPRSVSFRELHERDGAPVAHRLMAPDGREVPRRDAEKGYEVEPGRWVVLDGDELKAADAPARKAIELEDFVPGEQVDPVFWDRAYHLGPGTGGERGYATLAAALERTGRVGIGRVVLRSREQVVGVRAEDGVLRMHTMRHADELVPASALDLPEPSRAPSEREEAMADRLVESLRADFDHARYEDTYRERVEALVAAKARGEEPELPRFERPQESDDLLAALEASLEEAKR